MKSCIDVEIKENKEQNRLQKLVDSLKARLWSPLTKSNKFVLVNFHRKHNKTQYYSEIFTIRRFSAV